MKTIKTSRRAYYRRAQIQSNSNSTLQALVESALSKQPTVKSRLETIDSSGETYRLIAKHEQIGGMLAGHLISFERGSYQLVIGDDPDATSLELDAIEPPQLEGTAQQFVTGVVYFCIFDNCVALIQTGSLRANALERHLAWLIRDKAEVLDNSDGIALVDEPHKAVAERIRKNHIKAINLGIPFMQEEAVTAQVTSVDNSGIINSREEEVTKFKADTALKGLLKKYLPIDRFSSLGLSDVVFDGDLEVWLQIKHPKYQRNHPASTTKLLDDLGIALRDQEEESVRLELRDGSTIQGSQLKISSAISLETIGGKPNIGSLYTSMSEWIKHLIANDEITL